MPLIPFPNVPQVPGVPAVPRLAGSSPVVSSLLGGAQGALLRMFQVSSKWGVFDKDGKPLGDPSKITGLLGGVLDSVGIGGQLSTDSVQYGKEWRVADFPVEQGGFASYNKVEISATPTVTLVYGGFESDRTAFLKQIESAASTLDLFNIVTPERTYINYNITGYDYERRSNKGATLMIVALHLKEIREVSAQFSTSEKSQINAPKSVSATATETAGKVQATAPEVSTLKALSTKLGGLF